MLWRNFNKYSNTILKLPKEIISWESHFQELVRMNCQPTICFFALRRTNQIRKLCNKWRSFTINSKTLKLLWSTATSAFASIPGICKSDTSWPKFMRRKTTFLRRNFSTKNVSFCSLWTRKPSNCPKNWRRR